MADLTEFNLAEARDGMAERISAVELTKRIWRRRVSALNALCWKRRKGARNGG